MSQEYFHKNIRGVWVQCWHDISINEDVKYVSGRKKDNFYLMYHIVLRIYVGRWQNQDHIVIKYGFGVEG